MLKSVQQSVHKYIDLFMTTGSRKINITHNEPSKQSTNAITMLQITQQISTNIL